MIDRREIQWNIFKKIEAWLSTLSWLDTKRAVEWEIDNQIHDEVNFLIWSSWNENTKGE